MKKLYLGALALYLSVLASYAQTAATVPADSTTYKTRKLRIEEVDFVSGHYSQNGNNSAVTGGIGTEKLTDFANTLDVQLSKYGARGRKNTFVFELGVDHYTSASSDKIDPFSVSSASSSDTRIYPSLSWTSSNEKTGNSFGFTGSLSHEFDYQSIGGAFQLSRLSKDKNRQLDLKVQAFLDTWKVILPVELRTPGMGSGSEGDSRGVDNSPRNSFSGSFSLSQVINTRLQALLVLEPSYQHGLLATKYQRDYFTDGTEQAETLPSDRYKLPIGLRLNYFAGDRFVFRTFYRYYLDNWGIRAHTAELEVPVKISSFLSVSPFYRYSEQQGTRYFKPYGQHAPGAGYFTSDYDLSTLHSNYLGAGIRMAPPKGVMGIQHLHSVELRYGHYMRSTGLSSDMVTLALKFKR